MLEALVGRHYIRFCLAGAVFFIGFASAEFLLHKGGLPIATGIYSALLAALVGLGKLATP